ncbi:hypothetical protein VTN77DRAFT_5728 [Rasamsonia byssochlamydoides]|uniref:uncharacterized protein n=1 Tax=Rasamsonia byssochlamydoides TaxID=89139 RepID=UPI0037437609
MEHQNSENSLAQSPLHPSKAHFPPLSTLSPNLPRSSQLTPKRRVVRLMGGRCSFTEQPDPKRPYLITTCMCPAGQFSSDKFSPTSDPECENCQHPLACHEDADSNFRQIKSHDAGTLGQLVPDPLRCPREGTVSALWACIQKHRLIHIRATPASGKSTLSRLLERHVQQKEPELPVLWCSWPTKFPEDVGRAYEKLLNYAFSIPHDKSVNWLELQALLIIDEAQESYSCSTFWNDFLKGNLRTTKDGLHNPAQYCSQRARQGQQYCFTIA